MFDSLGNVLIAMYAVILLGCGAWGYTSHLVTKRRRRIIRREFRVVPDEQLLTGLAELRRAMALQAQSERARDMHVRHWR